MADDSGEVIVKAGLNVPASCPLLIQFTDFVWQHLDKTVGDPNYMNIHPDAKYLDVSMEFKWSDTPVNVVLVIFTNNGVETPFELNLFPFHPPEIDANQLTTNYPITQNRNISAIKVQGSPVMDMILSYQNWLYVAYKINVILHQIGALYTSAQRPREVQFLQRYWDRYCNANIRFAVRSGYDIPWHRDSGEARFFAGPESVMFGNQRHAGFITGAIYVNRPQGLPNDQGGISFMKDGGVFSLFPRGGTCVTFLDPEIFHKVIPVRDGGAAEKKRDFVKRSSIFMEFYTDRAHVEQNMPIQPIFNRPSLPSMFRNANASYKFLKEYFEKNFSNGLRARGLNTNNVRQSIATAPNAVINEAYAYMPNTYPAFASNVHPGAPLKPLPDFFVFKVRGSNNLSKRQKLLNLYNLYINTLSNFNRIPSNSIYQGMRELGTTNAQIAEMRRPRYRPRVNENGSQINGNERNHQGFTFTRNFMRGNLNTGGV